MSSGRPCSPWAGGADAAWDVPPAGWGMKADIAVWDAATIADTATFEQPHQYAAGVHTVIVNGQVVFEEGAMTPARPGKVLYGPAYRPAR